MSAEHRKPVVAFVALAIIAAALVGMQRADARGGRMFAAVIGAGVHVDGRLPGTANELGDSSAVLGSVAWILAGELAGEPGAGAGGESVQVGAASKPRVERADAGPGRGAAGPAAPRPRRPEARATDRRRTGKSAPDRLRSEKGHAASSLPRAAKPGRPTTSPRDTAGSSGPALRRTAGGFRRDTRTAPRVDVRSARSERGSARAERRRDGHRTRHRGHRHAVKRLHALPRR